MSCALAHYESLQFVVINNRCRLYFWPRRNGLFLVSSSLCYEHLRFFTRQWFNLHLRFRTLGGSRRDPVKRTRQRALSTTDSSRYHRCCICWLRQYRVFHRSGLAPLARAIGCIWREDDVSSLPKTGVGYCSPNVPLPMGVRRRAGLQQL